jgi:hypothetical protein
VNDEFFAHNEVTKMQFKKLGIAAGVGLALAGASLPSSALILGVPGEALLVPLFTYGGNSPNNPFEDTFVRVAAPSNVGVEAIPNFFTATTTTPTDPDALFYQFPAPDASRIPYIKWYWYDSQSKYQDDGDDYVSPDDVVTLTASEILKPEVEGELGYLVVTNGSSEATRGAQFPLLGESAVQINDCDGDGFDVVTNPVLALTDRLDAANDDPLVIVDRPTRADNVKWNSAQWANGSGVPTVSPLLTGNRTGASDGLKGQFTAWDLSFGPRDGRLADGEEQCEFPNTGTYHVIWLDENGAGPANTFIFDSDENQISQSVLVPYELNVVPVDLTRKPRLADDNYSGFVRYRLDEYMDSAWDEAESAGAFFGFERVAEDDWVLLISQDLGTFCNGRTGADGCYQP